MMELLITDLGDKTVGIFPQTWKVDCPFTVGDSSLEERELFKNAIMGIYAEYAQGAVIAGYDFELTP